MQSYAEVIREKVWGKLKVIFDQATGGKPVITLDQVKHILETVLKETDPLEIDYVIKNSFRLDTDGNGSIDFPELVPPILYSGQLLTETTLWRDGSSTQAQGQQDVSWS